MVLEERGYRCRVREGRGQIKTEYCAVGHESLHA